MTVLIFDLDGTLINTGPLAIHAYKQAMVTCDFKSEEMPTDEAILKTFGLPDPEIWSTLMPKRSPEEQIRAFHLAGDSLRDSMGKADITIAGARETIAQLHRRGYTLTTASNCGLDYLDMAMSVQGLGEWMDRPLCLESVHGRKKVDILHELIRRYEHQDMVMIGDRSTDRDAAKAVDIPFVGCNFGFGDAGELAGAIAVVSDLPQLLNVFEGPTS